MSSSSPHRCSRSSSRQYSESRTTAEKSRAISDIFPTHPNSRPSIIHESLKKCSTFVLEVPAAICSGEPIERRGGSILYCKCLALPNRKTQAACAGESRGSRREGLVIARSQAQVF